MLPSRCSPRPLAGGLLFGLLVGLAGAADLPPGLPPLRVFTAHDTGVATTAWSIAQGPDGTMYFGCNTVVSFNGDHWRTEPMADTYLVRGLEFGPDGRLWAAGVNQLGWFEGPAAGELAYHSLNGALEPSEPGLGEIWRSYGEDGGRAYFVLRDRVLHWDGRRLQSWSLPGQNILWATRTPRSIYVHYLPQGLLRLGPAGPAVAIPAAALGRAEIRWLDDAGPAWLLVTTQGLAQWHAGRCDPIEGPASRFVQTYGPTSVVKLSDGSLAVGTLRGGVAIIDRQGAIRQRFDRPSGLPADQIYALFVARDGALWGAGPAYIFRLGLQSGTTLYGAGAGYPAGGADSLAEYENAIYAASQSGLRRLDPDPIGGGGHFVELAPRGARIFSVESTPGGLLLATLNGLARWTGRELRPIQNSAEAVFRTQPSTAHPGQVLASLRDRVVLVDPVAETATLVADHLPDYGDSIADDLAGRIWIGTPSRGLFLARPGQTRAQSIGLGQGPTGPAVVATAGTAVVALTNRGAFVQTPLSKAFEPVDDFPAGHPVAVSNVGNDGEFWAAVEMGNGALRLGRIDPTRDRWRWTLASIEGFPDVGSVQSLHIARVAGEEELWVAGTEAMLRATPKALRARPLPAPRVRLWQSHNRGPGPVPADRSLPFDQRQLYAEFGSMDFGRRDPDRFETWLEGAETEWQAADQSARRDLAGLREGSYRLRVRLASEAGELGPEAEIPFSIRPPWWRSGAAYAGDAVALGLLAAFLLRQRTHVLHRRAAVLEETVGRRTAELERANAAKTDFVASMSHEIRNPMGGILSSALQLESTPLSEEQRGLVSTLSSCAQFLSKLVEDVLDFAAIEAGAYQISFAPLNPEKILQTVALMLGPTKGEHALHLHVDEDLPRALIGDAGRIQQILMNFTANALKFGGPTIRLSARREGSSCLFAVADDGPGIPLAEQELLFVRFSRLKAARNSAIAGTGLGLAVSRELAQRMGGAVGVVSHPGKGALFFLRIPLRPVGGGGAEPDQPTGGRALIVEDVAYNARALAFMLKRHGYAADVAATGAQALLRLHASRYDVVFIDCDVPEVSGIEVARRYRATEGPERTLLIATTALTSAANEQACRIAGMDRFLAKPVTPEKLRQALAHSGSNHLPSAESRELSFALLSHLTDGSRDALKVEVAKYTAALTEALAALPPAAGAAPHQALTTAAHRILGLARLTNAVELAENARDLQDYAAVLTPEEVCAGVAALNRGGAELMETLARSLTTSPADGTPYGPSSPPRRYPGPSWQL